MKKKAQYALIDAYQGPVKGSYDITFSFLSLNASTLNNFTKTRSNKKDLAVVRVEP